MGWIEDLGKEQGKRSVRAVAKAMMETESWPVGETRDLETVANNLRHADKGKGTAWWLGTGRSLLPALAEVLQEDEEGLVERLQSKPAESREALALWPFKMFSALRPLDLQVEDPFPGIPAELWQKGGPRAGRTWWVAPTGAGKTLLGRYLELRYGWTVIAAERWAEVELPEQGRVYVELATTAGLTVEVLEALPEGVRVCIAAPKPPPGRRQERPPGWEGWRGEVPETPPKDWQIVHVPPPGSWVLPLVDWAGARVRPGGGFKIREVESLIEAQKLTELFETPGDLIGFLGMVDDVGLKGLDQDPLRWVRVWLKAMLERPDRRVSVGVASLLGRQGAEMLVAMEVERLRQNFDKPLSQEAWSALVPRDQAPELDRERLLAAADEGLDAVRAMLRPDGASVVAGLKAVGALVEAEADGLALRPAWVANTVADAAVERLDEEVPEGLGTLLLFPNTSGSALRRLLDEVWAGQFGRVEACLTAGPATPEALAAIDGAFRAVGIAVALGVEVPLDLVARVWAGQMANTAKRFPNWPPVPWLTVASQGRGRGITEWDTWFLAAFSLSRVLVDAGHEVPSTLNPWRGLPEDLEERAACLEALQRASHGVWEEETELRIAACRVGGLLLDRIGVVRRQQQILPSQAPDALVLIASGKGLEINDKECEELVGLAFGLPALEDACARRGVDLDDVLGWCWAYWGKDWNVPPGRWLQEVPTSVRTREVERLWRAAPPATLQDKLLRYLGNRHQVLPWLSEAVWARWLEHWPFENRGSDEDAAAFWLIPEQLALRALREGRVDPWNHKVREILWARMPAALLALIDELASWQPRPHPKHPSGTGTAGELVYAGPAEYVPALVERAGTWMASLGDYPGVRAWLRGWLTWVVEKRSPEWRKAFELLRNWHTNEQA